MAAKGLTFSGFKNEEIATMCHDFRAIGNAREELYKCAPGFYTAISRLGGRADSGTGWLCVRLFCCFANIRVTTNISKRLLMKLLSVAVRRWICIYAAYINSKKTLAEGRRVPKHKV